jgi:hypothetical protein
MRLSRILTVLVVLLLLQVALHVSADSFNPPKTIANNTDTAIIVPLGGNAWRMDKDTPGGNITNDGIVNWTKKKAEFVAYVRFAKKGSIKLWLSLKVPDGQTVLEVSTLKDSKEVLAKGNELKDHYVGEWAVKDTGYAAIKIRAVSKTGAVFANISAMKLSGSAISSRTAWVKNNDGDFFYWGRRGPSVHLNYLYPDKENVEWFYNEVTVPKGNDVLGSYFMACGFGEGYFGMQVNSPTERHILFSVWSPFNTDDPKKIPDDQKIKMLKKGPDVHAGEFGSEGSGGQSYLLYNWIAGNTYKFLVQAKPDENNQTIYTAWFFAPELGSWHLIASFSRPQTNTYLKHLHSFLENFDPEQGTITRKVYFNNAWIGEENGNWTELNKARFTCDNTGAKGYRMDYAGGVEDASFYLKNCGFFDHYNIRNSVFERPFKAVKPYVDFDKLP